MKFRVLKGCHSEGHHADKSACIYYADGSGDGCIVDSASDLSKLNHPGAVKFERVFDETAEESIRRQVANSTGQKSPAIPNQDTPVAQAAREGFSHGDTTTQTLETMTLPELKKMAEEEEIDLGTATRKDQIIQIIKSAYEPTKTG